MISAGNLKNGMAFSMDGNLYEVLEFQHVKTGRGGAFLRMKIKDIMTDGSKEVTLNPNDKYERAIIVDTEMQYIYNEGDLYYFMDNETYNQIPISKDILEETLPYMKENSNVTVRSYENRPFKVLAPNFVELEVTQTEPGIKGDTASGAVKNAVVETGASINVPLFVELGDVIQIDTRTGEYVSRV